jgi:hypothetical protein
VSYSVLKPLLRPFCNGFFVPVVESQALVDFLEVPG